MTFYDSLEEFTDFGSFTEDSYFKNLPDDWYVVITDIKGSTKAISEGRYKEVNTIGAATIVMARKAMKNADFPFVFGGDGATLLIPEKFVHRVCENLCALKNLARDNHNLDLRIGVVPMKQVIEANKSVVVGKFQLTPGRSIAILKGDGLSWAEKEIKSSDKYNYDKKVVFEADLTGLSCRWNPMPSKNGKILTILLSSNSGKDVYTQFLSKLNSIFPMGLDSANPANIEAATYKSLSQLIKDEVKLHQGYFSLSFIKRMIEIVFAVAIFKYNIPPLIFDPKKYANSMRSHSDFRKFDDILRMVIDCNQEQEKQIESYLIDGHKNKSFCFGLHKSDNSLMTCYVDGLNQGEHIHFIDAENGGYAAAAIQLKKQYSENR